MTKTGLFARSMSCMNSCAFFTMRSASPLITPPGSSTASKSCASARFNDSSTSNLSALSWCLKPCTLSSMFDIRMHFAPAFSTASRGLVISICSKPSVTRIATRFPSSSSLIDDLRNAVRCKFRSLGCLIESRKPGDRNTFPGPSVLLLRDLPQEAVADVVNPAVDRQRLPARQRVADDRRLLDVRHLFQDVELAQSAVPRHFVAQRVHVRRSFPAHVLYMPEPVVDQPQLVIA